LVHFGIVVDATADSYRKEQQSVCLRYTD